MCISYDNADAIQKFRQYQPPMEYEDTIMKNAITCSETLGLLRYLHGYAVTSTDVSVLTLASCLPLSSWSASLMPHNR